jgi:hypothetical protein
MDLKTLRDFIIEFLKGEGYKPIAQDTDEYIFFKVEGLSYYVRLYEFDYVQLCKLYKCDFRSDDEIQKGLQIVNSLNLKCNMGSIALDLENNLLCVKEGIFFVNPDDFKQPFYLCFGIMQQIIDEFNNAIWRGVEEK